VGKKKEQSTVACKIATHNSMTQREVVVTGLGVVSPMDNGEGVDKFWKGLCEARNTVKPIRSFAVDGYKCQVGGEISGFGKFLQDPLLKDHSRCTRLFALATQQAFEDSGLTSDYDHIGVSFGSILGEMQAKQAYMEKAFFQNDSKNVASLEKLSLHSIPAYIAERWNLKGSNMCVSTACSSGADAIGLAFNEIRNGRAKVMLAGGADIMSEFLFRGFSALEALTKDNVVRPFSKNRTGLAVSEGAGALILEEVNHARSRNAKILCSVSGYGSTTDGYHLARPHKEGAGLARAITVALKEARIKPENVDYICAHGTGTILNDLAETKAIESSFGGYAKKVKISSIKSMIGHSMGASSALETICCIKTLLHNIVPPTINYEVPDPDCKLDYVPNVACKTKVDTAITLSAGFGGQNSVIVLNNRL